ncbi:hypothetical protein P0G09_17295, partial [Faecalibacterium sp. DFI.5.82]|nr:hypothetical protein [Faecalibacterium sp. DFI.5.82]
HQLQTGVDGVLADLLDVLAGLKLVDCPIRHLGTEKAQQLYLAIQNYLADNGVEMLFSTECENIILENEVCKGVFIKGPKDEEAYAVCADDHSIGINSIGFLVLGS